MNQIHRMRHPASWLAVGLLVVLACRDSSPSLTEPVDSPVPVPSSGLHVSDPVARGTADSVAYVSLLPGSVPGGTGAVVRNLANGISLAAPMQDGGFDPLAIPARSGDTVQIEIATVGGGPVLMREKVEPRRPPRVVRTSPPKGKVDVPLNSVIIVVFSQPMDPVTIRPDVIQVLLNGEPVPGTVSLQANGWEARLVSAAPLAPNTDYDLVVSTQAADLGGDGLAQQVEVPFTTGTRSSSAVSLTVSGGQSIPRGRADLPARVDAHDAAGNLVTLLSVQWSSSDPAIVSIDSSHVASAWFTARNPGTADIIALADGLVDTAQVRVWTRSSFTSIAAGVDHTCATAPSNQVFCWGSNVDRQLTQAVPYGQPSTNIPVAIFEPSDLMSSLTLGAGLSSGMSLGDSAKWWGTWPVGVPGADAFLVSGPYRLVGGDSVIALSTGERHICAVRGPTGRRAVCWGGNELGQLGDGRTYVSSWSWTIRDILPVAVSSSISFIDITAGSHHTCGLTAGGLAYCWGDNAAGQVGGGGVVVTRPQAIPGLTFVALRAGRAHSCGLVAGGGAYCWGDNTSGQLGAPGQGVGQGPVSGGLVFTDLSLGADHTCGITAGGQAFCWGDNQFGQLGDGSNVGTSSPVAVSGGLLFTSVSAGGRHTCGMTAGGLAYCWGANGHGQIGDQTGLNRSTPVMVVGQP